MVNILLYEDNQAFRESLALLLTARSDYVVVGAFASGADIVRQVRLLQPDVVLMDIDMPQVSGIAGLRLIRQHQLPTKVVMLTVFDDNQRVFAAMQAGADGYLLKRTPPAQLLEAIQDVLEGGAPMTSSVARQVLHLFAHSSLGSQQADYALSEREKEVLMWLVNGYSYKLIAAELFISLETVRSHIKNIYQKLQVNSKSEAVAKAFTDKLLP